MNHKKISFHAGRIFNTVYLFFISNKDSAVKRFCRVLILLLIVFLSVENAISKEDSKIRSNGNSNTARNSDLIIPVSVWTSAETGKGHPIELSVDDDWNTYTEILDDSRTGSKPHVYPPQGSTPVTASVVFDLGQIREVGGIRLTASQSWVYRMPQSVSVFSCSDPKGIGSKKLLCENAELPPLASSNSGFISWPMIETRYILLQINDSWEKSFWPGIESFDIQYDVAGSDFRYKAFPNDGWWMGIQKTICRENGLDSHGFGSRFLVQIAEAVFYRDEPDDFIRPNKPETAYPKDRLVRDWIYQDHGLDVTGCFHSKKDSVIEKAMLMKVLTELPADTAEMTDYKKRMTGLMNVPGSDPRWKDLYIDACQTRRNIRLRFLIEEEEVRQILYVRHCLLGGWTGAACTEDLSDGEHDIHNPDWKPGSQLCRLTLKNDGSISNEILLDKPNGLIRDPNFSSDAQTLVFSMRDNFKTDDYHLYLMDMKTGSVKQITFSPTVNGKPIPCADTDPVFTADGKIVFQSTRNINQDVCWIQATSNIFTCEPDGTGIRRLGYDQLHTFNPQVLNDGRIIYTRWEYNDRTHGFMQALFTMNADGTNQTEYYGNNSWYPNTIYQTRAIPDSNKVIAIISGHHCNAKGKLALIDTSLGTQSDSGIEFVAGASPDGSPGRKRSEVMKGIQWSPQLRWPIDKFGQMGPQYQYPFAFDDSHYLCTFLPEGCCFEKGPFNPPFGIYYMTDNGRRELLAFDWGISSCQSVPQIKRELPAPRGTQTDWKKAFGRFYIDDVYFGPGLKGIPRGTVKTIRVVALEYRAARVGTSSGNNRGIGGDTPVQTPIGVPNCSYDVKHVLGQVDVEADGSACFDVPACTPVYFQLLDQRGRCVQSMRSWSTLMPGEYLACYGCHESKREIGAAVTKRKIAMDKPVQRLKPHAGLEHPLIQRLEKGDRSVSLDNFMSVNSIKPLDPNAPTDGFSYPTLVQPILDRHCVECHNGESTSGSSSEKRNIESSVHNADSIKIKPAAPDLTGTAVPGGGSSYRIFSKSYFNLTAEGEKISCQDELEAFRLKKGRDPITVWYHPQGSAEMIAPYSAGSGRSFLMNCLDSGHYGVQLSPTEKQIIACWIDLSVPFCGSYTQANTWPDQLREKYKYYQFKRKYFAEQEFNLFKNKKK